MTHTPGPWIVRSEPGASSGDNPDEGWWYTLHAKADQDTFAEHEDNARIMGASLDLLAALKFLVSDVVDFPVNPRALEEARAAIAKAEGTK